MLRDALIENLHRAQLDPLEEAAAYKQLLDDFGATHEQLAQRIGRSRSHISNTLRLLGLPPAVQKRVAAGVSARATPAPCWGSTRRSRRSAWRSGSSLKDSRSARSRRSSPSAATTTRKGRAQAGHRQAGRPGPPPPVGRLSDLFETRVKVEMGPNKGKITVEFATIDDLERIVKAMSPEATLLRRSGRALPKSKA